MIKCPSCGSIQVRISTLVNYKEYGLDYIFKCVCGILKTGFIGIHSLIHDNAKNIVIKEVFDDYS